jgi:Heavy metal binding domain
MNLSRLMALPLVVAALLLMTTNSYYAPVASAVQKEPAADPKKAAPLEYVCPMHPEVQSTSRGVCPKCQMTLVKKRKVKTSGASGATRGQRSKGPLQEQHNTG